jgi:hypothetical protein
VGAVTIATYVCSFCGGLLSSELESSEFESSGVESSELESSGVESSGVESSGVESSEFESSGVESSGFGLFIEESDVITEESFRYFERAS